MKDDYTILVKFTRSLSDDGDVCGSVKIADLRKQFIKELQAAYEYAGISGSFNVLKIVKP
jgi:hypothetical protein